MKALDIFAILFSILATSLSYDTYTFYPAQSYMDAGNFYTTGVSLLTFSDDLQFMAVRGNLAQHSLQIYYKGTDGYSFLYNVVEPDGSSLSASQIFMTGSEPFVYLIAYFSDIQLRVFKITKEEATYKQTIPVSAINSIMGSSLNYIIITSSTNTTVYEWNSPSENYNYKTEVYLAADHNYRARAVTPDGAYLVTDQGARSTTELNLYELVTTTPLGSYDLSTVMTNSIQKMVIQTSGADYIVIISYADGTNFGVIRLLISGGSLSFLDQSVPIASPSFYSMAMSQNGNYLIFYSNDPRTADYYEYDSSTLTFNLLFSKNNFPSVLSPQAFFASNDGSLFSAGATGVDTNNGIIYFKCTVSNCSKCKFIGLCDNATSASSSTTTTQTTNNVYNYPTNTSATTSDESKNMLLFLVIAVIFLLLGTLAGLVFLSCKIQHLRNQPERKDERREERREEGREGGREGSALGPSLNEKTGRMSLDFNETNFKLGSVPSDVKIVQFINEQQQVELQSPSGSPKRRRLRKDRLLDEGDMIRVKPWKPENEEQQFEEN